MISLAIVGSGPYGLSLAAHLNQIERVNPKVNAIVTLVPEMAAAAATKADEMQAHNETLGPLHGLPVAHKDLFETRGIETVFFPKARGRIPPDFNEEDLEKIGLLLARVHNIGAQKPALHRHTFNADMGWAAEQLLLREERVAAEIIPALG